MPPSLAPPVSVGGRRVATIALTLVALSVSALGVARAQHPPIDPPIGPRSETGVSVDPAIVAAARSGNTEKLRAVVSFGELQSSRIVTERHRQAEGRTVAYFHAFRGMRSDWTGGYQLPVAALPASLDEHHRDYEGDHRAMLLTSIAHARAGLAAEPAEEQGSWQLLLDDLEARLDEFDSLGLMLYGYTVEASAADLLAITTASPTHSVWLESDGHRTPDVPWQTDR